MRQIILIVILAVVLLLAVAVVLLGAFPPTPAPQPVQHVLPNDRFQTQ